MQKPFFSIITVTYNSEKTIRDTIESVLQQTYINYEYIIVDGKSTDNTISIIQSYIDKFNGKLRVISESDNGIYDAMNKGIKLAKGDIVGIINSDDWYEKIALEKVAELYSEDEYLIYHGMMRTVDSENGKEIRCSIQNPEYIREAMINHPATFVNRKVYEKFGAFNCVYKLSADYDFIIRMTQERKVRFISIYEVLANFRTNGASASLDGLIETMRIKRNYRMMTNLQYLAAIIYLQARKLFGYYTR